MKTHLTVCMVLLCILYIQQPASILPSTCGTAPYPVEVTQQDGSAITVVAIGNAVIHHTETTDGYTILKNQEGLYEYAVVDHDGNLKCSGILAKDAEHRSSSDGLLLEEFQKHVRVDDATRVELIRQHERSHNNVFQKEPGEQAHRFPTSGSRKALVLLIQYPDLPNEYDAATFEDLMNEPGYNGTGSFRDFFLKNSFGTLDIESDVFGWYTAEHNFEHYGYLNGFQRTRLLMAEAIDAAEAAGVDFSQYDNDGDGKVDAVIGVHAGPGAEMGAQLQYIWSHRWTLGSYERNYDGVKISDYIVNPETRPWGMVGIGVFCHEFGHVLGLPDLYDSDNSSRGIGNWGVMGNGAWLNQERVPANMNAWCRQDMEWITPEVIEHGSYSLENADEHAACYRINTPDQNEYFLLENRQKTGNDAFLPGNGLAIWHINKERTSLYPISNNVNADETNKGVGLEEADGLEQLDNGLTQGDAGDLYPGSAFKTTFAAETTPSSDLNDGSESGISVTNIYESNGVVYFRLNDPAGCSITNLIVGQRSGCSDGFYDQEITIEYEYAPANGQLVVNGQAFSITGSPQTVLLAGLPSDGQVYDIQAYFTDEEGCALIKENAFSAPQSYQITLEQTTCDPAAAGQQLYSGQSVDDCDSSVLVITTLLESYDYVINSTTCLATEAGSTVLNLNSVNGCDSTVTINIEYEPVEELLIESTTCDPAEAGTSTLTFQSSQGCDSVVTYVTTLLQSIRHHVTEVTCDPAEVDIEYLQFEASNGCDSTVIIRTSLVPSYDYEVEEMTCDPEQAGTVSHLYSTVFGCDSMVTTHKIYDPMEISFTYDLEGRRIQLMNTSVNADHLMWLFGDGGYYIGDGPIHEYRRPGLYFVLLLAIDEDCGTFDARGEWILVQDESFGTVDDTDENTQEGSKAAEMSIYPNPTFGPVHLETNGLHGTTAKMSLFDINGKVVLTDQLTDANSTESFDLSGVGPGIYTMQIANDTQIINRRVFLTN